MGQNQNRTPFSKVLDEIDRKYSNFDGDGYQQPYYDYAEGIQDEPSKLYQADPYQIIIENKSTSAEMAYLFGFNRLLLAKNFGNPETIRLTMGQPDTEYVEILQSSATNPFSTQMIRIESENPLQVTKFLSVTKKGISGNGHRQTINMQQYKSAFQNDKNMIDAPLNLFVDGSTYWQIEIEPETRVFYTIFPMYKVDTSATLQGEQPIKSFAPAKVNTASIVLPQAQNLLRRG